MMIIVNSRLPHCLPVMLADLQSNSIYADCVFPRSKKIPGLTVNDYNLSCYKDQKIIKATNTDYKTITDDNKNLHMCTDTALIHVITRWILMWQQKCMMEVCVQIHLATQSVPVYPFLNPNLSKITSNKSALYVHTSMHFKQ